MDRFADSNDLRQLLNAVLVIGSDLELPAVLRRIVEAAVELSGAKYGALGVLDEGRSSLAEFVTVGLDEETIERIGPLPKGHGILGVLIDRPVPLRLPVLSEHSDSFGFPEHHPEMTSFLGVPIMIRGEAYGNLYLCDKESGGAFTDLDEELVVALAASAAVAIENARLYSRVGNLVVIEDRERIARDLHDTVIQRLFAVGLNLQGALRLADKESVNDRIESAIDELDTTVREIRTAIFELHSPRLPNSSTRQAVLELCAESARTLGFAPTIKFEGAIDAAVDVTTAEHILAVLREALANVAKHAAATAVEVKLAEAGGLVQIEVRDNGRGAAEGRPTGGRGLDNMSARARKLSGECSLTANPGGGSCLQWWVPTSP